MEKKNTILLTVIAVATLLVAVVGATFAYFTASVTNDNSETNKANVTTTKLAGLNFNVEALKNLAPEGDVYPGWMGYQKLTAEGAGGDGKGRYTLTMTVTGGTELLAGMKYTLYKGTAAGDPTTTNGTVNQTEDNHYSIDGAAFTAPAGFTAVTGHENVALTSGDIVVKQDFTGTQNDIYYIVYSYPNDEAVDQSAAMGQTFTATIKASLETVQD